MPIGESDSDIEEIRQSSRKLAPAQSDPTAMDDGSGNGNESERMDENASQVTPTTPSGAVMAIQSGWGVFKNWTATQVRNLSQPTTPNASTPTASPRHDYGGTFIPRTLPGERYYGARPPGDDFEWESGSSSSSE